jgi:hypothetical protein
MSYLGIMQSITPHTIIQLKSPTTLQLKVKQNQQNSCNTNTVLLHPTATKSSKIRKAKGNQGKKTPKCDLPQLIAQERYCPGNNEILSSAKTTI